MKKNFIIGLTLILMLSVSIPFTSVYAIAKQEQVEEETFFKVSQTEIAKTEILEMTLQLDKVNYETFTFQLQSDTSINEVEIENEEEEKLDIDRNSNEICIELDKETTNLKQVMFYFQIPDTLEEGDVVTLIATVTNLENKEEIEEVQTEIKIVDKEADAEQEETSEKENSEEKQDMMNQGNMQLEQETTNEQKSEINKQQGENTTVKQTNTTLASTTVSGKTTIQNTQTSQETVTYNGSDNNYLSELVISNYTLNKTFSKENTTYFVTVEQGTESIEISAVQEDENASVCIYGNENLQEGLNKVLVSVTAENGNIRNYRIYVTKPA